MKQPGPGNKIDEIRHQKGITQQELADLCKVDIRTIQRIESGEVEPRMSTLKVIATGLGCPVETLVASETEYNTSYLPKLLLFSFVTGFVYVISWLIYSRLLPGDVVPVPFKMSFLVWALYLLSGVMFYFGFYTLGKRQKNVIMQVSVMIIMVLIPLDVVSNLLIYATDFPWGTELKTIIVTILGLNGIFFGISLLRQDEHHILLYKIAGILQILLSPLILIPVRLIQYTGLWMAVPFLIILEIILWKEYREQRTMRLATVI